MFYVKGNESSIKLSYKYIVSLLAKTHYCKCQGVGEKLIISMSTSLIRNMYWMTYFEINLRCLSFVSNQVHHNKIIQNILRIYIFRYWSK